MTSSNNPLRSCVRQLCRFNFHLAFAQGKHNISGLGMFGLRFLFHNTILQCSILQSQEENKKILRIPSYVISPCVAEA